MSLQENHLKGEKSPYLLQHVHNPVDWYPWGEEAFRKAQMENKPIFLSIGYSTCHWCHVMEKESFEDPEVASEMNRVFVSIKVDREERPDVDSVYMTASQVMTGTGGWPLNMILTPDRKPVFAFTYIPKESRRGNIGMIDLCRQVGELWSEGPENILSRSQEVMDGITRATALKKNSRKLNDIQDIVIDALKSSFDSENGGFGSAPKFPSAHNLLFLLDRYHHTGEIELLEMVEKTLKGMRMGGIFDHIGYGFHRYSTDPSWILPHFEKMLYDQAMLIMIYSEAYSATGNKFYRNTVLEVADFLRNEMMSSEGGFFSALDADSEGEEGKYYTWSMNDILMALGPEDGNIFCEFYNVERNGNYQDEATGRSLQKNILYSTTTPEEFASSHGMKTGDLERILEKSRKTLAAIRSRRPRPHLDDKILCDTNGLAVAALSIAYRRTGEEDLIDMAEKAALFMLEKLYSNGHLLHRYRDSEAAINGFLDDYAFTIFGFLELYFSTFKNSYLEAALKLQETLDKEFWDTSGKGYFQTPDSGEELFTRPKEGHDGAIPGGNSVEIENMVRLSRITANPLLKERAADIAETFSGDIEAVPMFHSYMAMSIGKVIGRGYLLKVWKSHPDLADIKNKFWEHYLPEVDVAILDPASEGILEKSEVATGNVPSEAEKQILACTDSECLKPAHTLDEILMEIGQPK